MDHLPPVHRLPWWLALIGLKNCYIELFILLHFLGLATSYIPFITIYLFIYLGGTSDRM